MQSQSTDLQRNSVLPEFFLIICESFEVKMGDLELFAFFYVIEKKKRPPGAKPNFRQGKTKTIIR